MCRQSPLSSEWRDDARPVGTEESGAQPVEGGRGFMRLGAQMSNHDWDGMSLFKNLLFL